MKYTPHQVQLDPLSPSRGAILTFLAPHPIVEWNFIITRAGGQRGMHYHKYFHEFVTVVSGFGIYSIREDPTLKDEQRIKVSAGDTLHFPPGVAHALEAASEVRMLAMLTARWDEVPEPATRVEDW